MKNRNPKTRLFIRDAINANNIFQLLSFEQHKDGSIYCGFGPSFPNIIWHTFLQKEAGIYFMTESISDDGKLSIHASGMVALRAHNKKDHRLITRGTPLIYSFNPTHAGIRHLFTMFPVEPKFLPNSPAFNRNNDYIINAEKLNPFAIIFFALPNINLESTLNIEFNLDELKSSHLILELGGLSLRYHHILWSIYRTKHMDKWPQHTQITYHDGFHVPVYVGDTHKGLEGYRTIDIRLCEPTYKIINNEKIEILINAAKNSSAKKAELFSYC